jgi:hypothetical protein
MRENYKRKKKWDNLHHREVNSLFDAATRLGNERPGNNSSAIQSQSFCGQSPFPPSSLHTVEISSPMKQPEDYSTAQVKIYKCKVRYYDHGDAYDGKHWKTADAEHWVDGSDCSGQFYELERVTAYWNAQRGMFVAISKSGLSPVITTENLLPCGRCHARMLLPCDADDGDAEDCICSPYILGPSIHLFDQLGIVENTVLFYLYGLGDYIPSGSLAYARKLDRDDEVWTGTDEYEVIAFGISTCAGAGSGCRTPMLGFYKIIDINGYEIDKRQYLTHDENDCLRWITPGNCDGGSGIIGSDGSWELQ